MKAILVGAGGMGKAWAKNLISNPETEIVAWVDVVPEAAKQAAEQHTLNVQTFTSLTEAIREIEADFVVDVTVPDAHEAVTIEALESGLPVLGEKPMSSSIASAKKMISASEKSGKLYMVSQSRRYDGRQDAFKEAISTIGQLGILNVDFYIGAHFGGFRDEMENVLILDMAIHTLDQARFLSGLNPVSVYADEFNTNWTWYRHGSSINCLFEMEGGVRFSYRGSWCADGLHTSWEGDWRAAGSNGSATWNGHNEIFAETVENRDNGQFFLPVVQKQFDPQTKPGGISASLNEFIHALRTGVTPNGECHDNLYSLAMVFGAIESAKRGERVQISEILS